MDHDVFLCHAPADRKVAELLCRALEAVQLRCWYGPRDLQAGPPPEEQVEAALQACRRVVLIRSTAASQAPELAKQLRDAVQLQLPILQFAVEEVLSGSPRPSIQVFISANHADYGYAEQLYEFLDLQGIRAFFCKRSLPQLHAADFRKAIDQNLDLARHMIVVTSAAEHVRSQWVEAEWGFFINEQRSGNKSGNLIVVAAGPIINRELPPALRHTEIIPLAADNLDRILQYVDYESSCLSFEDKLKRFVKKVYEQVRGPDLGRPLAGVAAALRQLPTDAPLTLAGLVQVIETAIAVGAPVYNAGSPEGCAQIYLHAAQGLLALAEKLPAQAATGSKPPRAAAALDDFRRIVAEYPSVTHANANRLAWNLRHVFDRIILQRVVERGQHSVDELLTRIRESGQPLRSEQLANVLGLAIAHGNILYKEGDYQGIVELHQHTARQLFAHLPPPPETNGRVHDRELELAREELAALLAAPDPVTAEQAESRAWELYKAFLRILKID